MQSVRHISEYEDLPSVSFSNEAGGSMKTLDVMRHRMTDGATNRCDANVGFRRKSILNVIST